MTDAARAKRPTQYWLWMLVIAMTAVALGVAVGNAVAPADRALGRDTFGQDFLAFHSAGRIIRDGSPHDLYDLAALSQWQAAIASEAGLKQVAPVAPWLNPPQFALLFAPLASLSFHAALATWWALSLAFLAGAAVILSAIVREASDRRRDWLLVPALLAVAPPTLQSFGHGQNTALSLLVLSAAVCAWRAGRPIWGGIACSVLFYKPQLAAIIALAMFATLGWRVAVGLLIGLVPQMLATVALLPGAMTDFIQRVPDSVTWYRAQHPELVSRHATVNAFWRFALDPHGTGRSAGLVAVLSIVCVIAVIGTLAYAWWKLRPMIAAEDGPSLDRLIALVLLAMPLSMPYFMDYDLLMLAIAGVLVGREFLETGERSTLARRIQWIGCGTFVWLLFNPVLAEIAGVNLTVPLLVTLFAIHARRCVRGDQLASSTIEMAVPTASVSRLAA